MEYAMIAKEMLGNLLYFGEQVPKLYNKIAANFVLAVIGNNQQFRRRCPNNIHTAAVPPQQYRFQAGRPLSI
jgi:hypothetical protein